MANVPEYQNSIIIKDSIRDDIGIQLYCENKKDLIHIIKQTLPELERGSDNGDVIREIIRAYVDQYGFEDLYIYSHIDKMRYCYAHEIIWVFATENVVSYKGKSISFTELIQDHTKFITIYEENNNGR